MDAIGNLNIVAIIAAAIVNVVIGAMWFNAPFLFQKTWLAGIGKTSEEVAADSSPLNLVAAVVGAVIVSVALAVVVNWANAVTLVDGIVVGLVVGVAQVAVMGGIKDLFEGRPVSFVAINIAHDLVVFGLMGAILGALR